MHITWYSMYDNVAYEQSLALSCAPSFLFSFNNIIDFLHRFWDNMLCMMHKSKFCGHVSPKYVNKRVPLTSTKALCDVTNSYCRIVCNIFTYGHVSESVGQHWSRRKCVLAVFFLGICKHVHEMMFMQNVCEIETLKPSFVGGLTYLYYPVLDDRQCHNVFMTHN